MTSGKLVATWVIGGLLLLAGTWVMTNTKPGPGVSDVQYAFSILISIALFLLAGLAWISVAAAARHA